MALQQEFARQTLPASLSDAIHNNDMRGFEALLNHYVRAEPRKIDEQNELGETALMYAASLSFKPAPRIKRESDANLHPLDRHYPSFVELLVKAGANPLLEDYNGVRASDEARSHGSEEAAKTLEKAEKDWIAAHPDALKEKARRTRTAKLFHALNNRDEKETWSAVAEGAHPDVTVPVASRYFAGFSPLTFSVHMEFREGVKILNEADPNRPDALGRLALVMAFRHDRIDLFEDLLKMGADPRQAEPGGKSALELIAASYKESAPSFVHMMAKYGADFNEPLPGGRTPLMLTAAVGTEETAEAFIKNGARASEKRLVEGRTESATDIAQNLRRTEMERLLRNAEQDELKKQVEDLKRQLAAPAAVAVSAQRPQGPR